MTQNHWQLPQLLLQKMASVKYALACCSHQIKVEWLSQAATALATGCLQNPCPIKSGEEAMLLNFAG